MLYSSSLAGLYAIREADAASRMRFRPRTRLLVTLIIYSSLFFSSAGFGQWRLLKTFPLPDSVRGPNNDAIITSICFLNLLGPPRIGFVGLSTTAPLDTTDHEGGEVWKTIDGGRTWRQVGPISERSFFGRGVYDFAFKDSLTGWLAASNPDGGCLKTTDGGNTWQHLSQAVLTTVHSRYTIMPQPTCYLYLSILTGPRSILLMKAALGVASVLILPRVALLMIP